MTNLLLKAMIKCALTATLALINVGSIATSVYAQSQDRNARGVVTAIDRATLSSGISSRISAINFRRGDEFESGDVLITFGCNLEKANASAALATYNGAKQALEKNRELLDFAATGKFDVEISKAEMERTRADYNAARAIVNECTIKAPFKGRVVSQFVQPFESVQVVQPLIEIVGTQSYEVTFIVSSSWLSWLTDDHEFTFVVDNMGDEISGRVNRIGAVIDPVSQTIEVIGIITSPTEYVKAGMSGVARFNLPIGG